MNDGIFLSVRNLKKHYPVEKGILSRTVGRVRAVDGVSFDLHRGETFGVVGESGCGKSTLAHTVMRLEEPTDGNVIFDGEDVTEYGDAELRGFRRRAQIIFQDPDSSLDPRMSIGESVEEPLRVQGMSDGERRRGIVSDLLERVGLSSEDSNRYPHELSGGQKQRVGLARALSVNPDLLVADEPVSALDVSTQAEILSLLDDLCGEFGLTVIVISHDISVVESICDRIGVMYVGEMVEKGKTEDVLSEASHPYTRALLSSVPKPDPSAEPPSASLRGEVPDPANPPSGCRFHPRCPEVITPREYEIKRDDLRKIMEFRKRLEEEPEEVLNTVVSEDSEDIRGAVGLPEVKDPQANDGLEDVIGELKDGSIEKAQTTLAEDFGTVCEREDPEEYEVGEQHLSRCLLHDRRFTEG